VDQNLKTWIVEGFAEADRAKLHKFLRIVKFAPEQALQRLCDNLDLWCMSFVVTASATVLSVNYEHDPQELLEAIKERFAKDLTTMAAQ
jgi:hypothetical protein